MTDEKSHLPRVSAAWRGSLAAAVLALLAACGKTPEPAAAPPVIVSPASVPVGSATAIAPSQVSASGAVVVPTVPSDPVVVAPSTGASAPLSVGVTPPDPSASVPAAASIGPASAPAGAQPPSVSPGSKQ